MTRTTRRSRRPPPDPEISLPSTNLVLVGGKGGVGKTTVAAATALQLSSRGDHVLLVSSDPAPSLSDIFETTIGGTITPLDTRLEALEIDATREMEGFRERFGGMVVDLISSLVPMDDDALQDIPTDVAPGLDELFAFETMIERMDGGYDSVIWDTAPTGHTVRLLALPAALKSYARGALSLHQRVAGTLDTIRSWFGTDASRDSVEEMMNSLIAMSERMQALLTRPGRTEFVPVAIPESLSLSQTGRLIDVIHNQSIPIRRLIINGVVPPRDCPFCTRRRAMQMAYVRQFRDIYEPEIPVVEMPLFATEIRGPELLRRYADLLYPSVADDAHEEEN